MENTFHFYLGNPEIVLVINKIIFILLNILIAKVFPTSDFAIAQKKSRLKAIITPQPQS